MSGINQEGDWEGFEGFNEVVEANNHSQVFPELTRIKTTPSNPTDPRPPRKALPRHRISPAKKHSLQAQQKVIKNQDNEAEVDSPTKKSVPFSTTTNYLHRKVEENRMSIEWNRSQFKRYERIPIARFQEELHRGGRVVYRSFIPRTSDFLLRSLKQVDWREGAKCESTKEPKCGAGVGLGIEFSSQFEGGNLAQAVYVRAGENEYDLYMRVDTNTCGHRQWFYFSMKNQQKCKVRLHIHRFKKPYSLFQRGMKPYVRSRKMDTDWRPGGTQVSYHLEHVRNQYGVKKALSSSVLTFNYSFRAENDEVFIAAGVPYTYSYLVKQLKLYKQIVEKRQNLSFDESTLCKTLCGLQIQTISVQHKMSRLIHDDGQRKFMIIIARTHPGEVSSSWVMNGVLRSLAKPEVEQMLLRQNLCLIIVPMFNPDGVFMGNYRTGIIGQDLNRRFTGSRKDLYPQICALKQLVAKCQREGQVDMFFDLHGHSVLRNSFIYGPSIEDFNNCKLRNLAYYLYHNSALLRLQSCSFTADDKKNNFARRYFQNKHQILSLTCQNSLGLCRIGSTKNSQLMPNQWQNFGEEILKAIADAYQGKEVAMPPIPERGSKKKVIKSDAKFSFKEEIQKKLGIESQGSSEVNAKMHFKVPASELRKMHFGSRKTGISESSEAKAKAITEISEAEEVKIAFKIRKKSDAFRKNLLTQYAKEEEPHSAKGKKREEENEEIGLVRAATYDSPSYLKEEIEKMRERQEEDEYQMKSIEQNFSDQYSSINDEDSSDEDLPTNQKKALFECIRSAQRSSIPEQQRDEAKVHRTAKSLSRETRVGGFRQIRFESIELEDNIKEKIEARMARRIKLEPHKFKDSRRWDRQSEDGMIPISQQKKLNERHSHWQRPNQKDPFILLQRFSPDKPAKKKFAFN